MIRLKFLECRKFVFSHARQEEPNANVTCYSQIKYNELNAPHELEGQSTLTVPTGLQVDLSPLGPNVHNVRRLEPRHIEMRAFADYFISDTTTKSVKDESTLAAIDCDNKEE